jgi:hypothetical protein
MGRSPVLVMPVINAGGARVFLAARERVKTAHETALPCVDVLIDRLADTG